MPQQNKESVARPETSGPISEFNPSTTIGLNCVVVTPSLVLVPSGVVSNVVVVTLGVVGVAATLRDVGIVATLGGVDTTLIVVVTPGTNDVAAPGVAARSTKNVATTEDTTLRA